MSFLYPENDEYSDDIQQQNNSKTAIASGELIGKKLSGNDEVASVNEGNFVSENQTDLIFAVAGEEYGFLGCCTIILLLLAISIECIRMGLRAKDLSGKIICCGMASIVSLQSFLNICVATGIAPNTGTPLPFVSYGLTSLVSLYLGMGLVLNVGLQSSAYNKEIRKKSVNQKEDSHVSAEEKRFRRDQQDLVILPHPLLPPEKKQPGQQDRQEVLHTLSKSKAKVHVLSVRHRQEEIRKHAGKNVPEEISFRL